MNVTVNSYFSGAGLFDIGLSEGGLNISQSFEIDKTCCATQRLNFNHEVIQCDISQKTVIQDKGCDVMVATYPCTKYSDAADIHGTRTGDELFLHFFRHIAIKRPEVYVIENVPGMRKFPVVMEAMSKLPDYYVSVFCPIQASIWLPQNRERLILIGSRKPFNWREPEKGKRIKLKDILEDNPDINIPDYVYNRLLGKGNYRDKPIVSDPDNDDIAPCVVAHYSKDKSTRLVKDKRFPYQVRPYTVREFARLQGVPDWFRFKGSQSKQYEMIGNGVPRHIGLWIAKEIKRYFS